MTDADYGHAVIEAAQVTRTDTANRLLICLNKMFVP